MTQNTIDWTIKEISGKFRPNMNIKGTMTSTVMYKNSTKEPSIFRPGRW